MRVSAVGTIHHGHTTTKTLRPPLSWNGLAGQFLGRGEALLRTHQRQGEAEEEPRQPDNERRQPERDARSPVDRQVGARLQPGPTQPGAVAPRTALARPA